MVKNTIIDTMICLLGMGGLILLLLSAARMSTELLGYCIVCFATFWTLIEFQAAYRTKPRRKYPRTK